MEVTKPCPPEYTGQLRGGPIRHGGFTNEPAVDGEEHLGKGGIRLGEETENGFGPMGFP